MFGGAVELPMNLAVTHDIFLNIRSVATARRTISSGGPPAFAQNTITGTKTRFALSAGLVVAQ
jgi:hypothetical protein